MANEYKTLLKIEGDASGAVRAAGQARAAVASMDQMLEPASETKVFRYGEMESALEAPIERVQQKTASRWERIKGYLGSNLWGGGDAGGAERTTEALNRMGMAAEVTHGNMRKLKMGLAMISPEFANVIQLTDVFKGSLFALATVPGAIMAGIAVAIGVVAAAYRKAQADLERMAAENDRIRSRFRERAGGVAGAAVKLGTGTEFNRRAEELARDLEGQGFAKDAAAQAGLIAAEFGMPREEMGRLAAWMQQGGEVGGPTRAARERGVAAFRRQAARPERAQAISNAAAQARDERRRLLLDAQAGDEGALRQLYEAQGMTPEHAAEAAASEAQIRKHGGEWQSQQPDIAFPGFGLIGAGYAAYRWAKGKFVPKPPDSQVERGLRGLERAGPRAGVTINNYGHMYNRDIEPGPEPQMGMA